MKPERDAALIVVDVQNDFCPGGALEVPDGDKVVSVLNEYIEVFEEEDLPIFFTKDWHPENHVSFKERGGPWPPHCVQNTEGAEFHPDLKVPEGATIVYKGDDPDKEAYSAFDGTELSDRLKELRVRKVYVGGLATDYCVKNTTLDALEENFETKLLTDATRGVNVNPKDSQEAIEEMTEKGAEKVALKQVVA